MTPEQRALAGRIGGHRRWANETDRTAATAKARRAFEDRFLREADPEGVLSAEARAKKAANLRKAYYAALQLKSSTARRRRRTA